MLLHTDSDMHTMERESTNNSTDEKKLKSQVETGFSSNASGIQYSYASVDMSM